MSDMKEIDYWVYPLLQGTAYWLGHSRMYYSDHLLKEGAIVAEAVKLIHSNLKSDEELNCEKMYKDFMDSQKGKRDFGQKRADITISKGSNLKHIIEVKRSVAFKTEIKKDLNRMAIAKTFIPDVRTFLLLVSEKKLPDEYVSEDGYAKTRRFDLEEGYFKVRRVCKAASSFKKKKSANYSCLIEVFNN